MKYDGNNWILVGSTTVSSIDAWNNKLTFGSDGTPYVAFNNGPQTYLAVVKKYNGITWEYVGSTDFSNYLSRPQSIEITQNDEIYLSCIEDTYMDKVNIYKFDGSEWDIISESIANLTYNEVSLVLNSLDEPIVSFQEDYGLYRVQTWTLLNKCISDEPDFTISEEGVFKIQLTNDAGCRVYSDNSVHMKKFVLDDHS